MARLCAASLSSWADLPACRAPQGGYADVGEEAPADELGKAIYRLMVIAYFVLLPSYFWYRWLYTIEWDVPYRMYYQTTICVAEMFGTQRRSAERPRECSMRDEAPTCGAYSAPPCVRW